MSTFRVRPGRIVSWKVPAVAAPAPRHRANNSYNEAYGYLSSSFAYDADSLYTQELGTWSPWLRSPDTEVNFYRDRRVARTRDLERNDGWARGAISRVVDDTIGSLFRLVARPNWRLLSRQAAACDAAWAQEFADVVEGEWRSYADDPLHWCDAEQSKSMVQMFRLQLRHKLLDGEDLAVVLWNPETIGAGAACYATTLQLIDPDRLSNPQEMVDTHTMRGGVEVNDQGAPVAYHLRRAHQYDMFDAEKSIVWDRIPRMTDWGRPIVLHDFDADRITQHRGVGILTPVLAGFRMLSKYDAAELQQALLQTVVGTFIESPYDPDQLRMAMEAPAGGEPMLNAYQGLRDSFHAANQLELGGVRIPTLVPGEKITFAPARHPSGNFDMFEHALLRRVASATGSTAEDITKDFSKANYSSLRAAMLGAWRTMIRRRSDFAVGFATPFYTTFLEELIDRTPGLLPRRAPDFMEMRAAYSRCRWIGPGRGWIDPVKERQGAVLGLDAGFGTLEDECAEISGADWREQLEQRAQEVGEFRRLGLKLPEWGGAADEPAAQIAAKPQPV